VSLQVVEIDPFERGLVAGGEADGRGHSGIERFLPAGNAEAPAVTGFQTGEVPFGGGGAQIIAPGGGEAQKLSRDFDADGVQAHITGTGAAVAVAVKSGHGLATAAGEGGSEDVGAHGGLGWIRLAVECLDGFGFDCQSKLLFPRRADRFSLELFWLIPLLVTVVLGKDAIDRALDLKGLALAGVDGVVADVRLDRRQRGFLVAAYADEDVVLAVDEAVPSDLGVFDLKVAVRR